MIGPRCRFYPSCSTYAKDTIKLNGLYMDYIKPLNALVVATNFQPVALTYQQKKEQNYEPHHLFN